MPKKALLFVLMLSMMSSFIYSQAPIITVSGSSIATAMVPNQQNAGILQFDMVRSKNTASWTAVTVDLTGTALDSDISAVEIWLDGGDNVWSNGTGDSQIGTGTFVSGTVAITLTTAQTIGTTSQRFYVVFDISGTASGARNAGAEFLNNSYFTAGNVATTNFPISSTDESLPVELGSWTADSDNGVVNLEWLTESEIENQGFIIERRGEYDTSFEEIASFITHAELLGQGSTTRQTFYQFTDEDVELGQRYEYRLADVDYVSNIIYHDVIEVVVKDDADAQLPGSITLQNAFPNPFNPLVNLGFMLETSSTITMSIYNVQGQLIEVIAQGAYNSGEYNFQWDGLSAQGEPQSTGVYIVHLSSDTENQIQRITLLR